MPSKGYQLSSTARKAGLFRIMYGLSKFCSRLRSHCRTFEHETMKRSTNKTWTFQLQVVEVHEFGKNFARVNLIRAHPRSTKHMTPYTPSNIQFRCRLLQVQDHNTTRPIGYGSRSLTDTNRKYDTTQRQC